MNFLPRMTELQEWASHWGDLASIAGALLTIIGFAVTIVGVWRSKAAADEARRAAEAVSDGIARYDAIADLSSSMAIMDEIKRLQRHGAWAILPDRYSHLRRHLVAIKGAPSPGSPLTEVQHQVIQSAIATFADLERRVDRALSSNAAPANPAKLNDIVSSKIDEVHSVLRQLQRTLGATA